MAKVTAKSEAMFNENNDELWCRVTWKVNLQNLTGREPTEAQRKALAAYCEKFVPWNFARAGIVGTAIVITPSEIYEAPKYSQEHRFLRYYDADTGTLYDEDELFDGKHEIRVKSTENHEIS